jgi:hypothetical protein
MNTYKHMKAVVSAGLIVLGLGLFSKAQAANPDTMSLFVTPSGFTYAVSIASPEVQGYDFTSVAINATTISTKAITVTNTGNISEYFSLAVNDITGGGNGWTNSTSNGNKTYVMQGLIQSAQPANATFAGATNNVPAAVPGTAASHFGQGTTQVAPLGTGNVWLQLLMPTGVSDTGQHTLVLSVNGQAS